MFRNDVVVLLLIAVLFLTAANCAGDAPSTPKDTVVKGASGGFVSIVKEVMKNAVTVSPAESNVGIPLSHSERVRIIGGVETSRNEFPFVVSFARDGRHFCGGAIISPEWMLTASHCAAEPDFDVTAGDHNLDVQEGPEQKSKAVLVIRHPDYNPVTYEDDICLVKVNPPFKFDEYVKPFAVPSTHYIASGTVTVAGWGTEDEAYQVVSPVLRKVSVPLVPSLQCSQQYGSYFRPLKMICAGEEEGGKDACQGDSGGPLMCDEKEGKATLCGVVSFGLGCARPQLAGVYTKVAYYSDWIAFEMSRNDGGKQVGGGAPTPPKKTTTTTTTRKPLPVPTTPWNPLKDIPPGSVVIIKPMDPAYTRPPPPPPNHVRPHISRGKSNTSRCWAESMRTLVFISLVTLVISFSNVIV